MKKKKRLLSEFYELRVNDLIDKRIWDLPLIVRNEDIKHVLSILSGKNHVWVIDNNINKNLLGVITEHDVLSVLAPKRFPSYVFGMSDIRSFQFGTAKTAGDVMTTKLITCGPEDKILDILQKMNKHNVIRLPVIDNKKIVGEITLHHLIRKYYSALRYYPILGKKD
jgi:predicted transcriptional regulator